MRISVADPKRLLLTLLAIVVVIGAVVYLVAGGSNGHQPPAAPGLSAQTTNTSTTSGTAPATTPSTSTTPTGPARQPGITSTTATPPPAVKVVPAPAKVKTVLTDSEQAPHLLLTETNSGQRQRIYMNETAGVEFSYTGAQLQFLQRGGKAYNYNSLQSCYIAEPAAANSISPDGLLMPLLPRGTSNISYSYPNARTVTFKERSPLTPRTLEATGTVIYQAHSDRIVSATVKTGQGTTQHAVISYTQTLPTPATPKKLCKATPLPQTAPAAPATTTTSATHKR